VSGAIESDRRQLICPWHRERRVAGRLAPSQHCERPRSSAPTCESAMRGEGAPAVGGRPFMQSG